MTFSPRSGPNDFTDPVALVTRLIRCPSVTPRDEGALDVLAGALEALGFTCHRLTFSAPGTPDVDNLYARLGDDEPNFCFAGHTDVVPVGTPEDWRYGPFAAEIADGKLYGRGAVDMKGAIAAFAAATARLLAEPGRSLSGSISMLITGDEEGPAINGTRKVLDWLADRHERIDWCLVGEPTNPTTLGQMIKIGRRGSLNARLLVHGIQGHVAYPAEAENPVHHLVTMLADLTGTPLDRGTEHFDPSSLQVTTVDVGNPTTNLIPARASAGLNIRFNDLHTGEELIAWLRSRLDRFGCRYDLDANVSGEAFLTPPGDLSTALSRAVENVTGRTPELSTSGGTSDARFIKDYCPVVEFGLINETAHKVDEHLSLAELEMLTSIYQRTLADFVLAG